MAKDGTNRGGARVGAGAKKKPLADKIAEGNLGGRKLTVMEFSDTADLEGQEMPEPNKMLEAIQKDGKKLFDKASIGQWYASQGLDINKFNELYNSFSINTKIARANDATRRYQIAGTPVVVVDGKYLVEGEDGKVPKVVDFLVKKARAEHGK